MEKGNPTINNYKELACAIIERQALDFLENYKKYDEYAFYNWCMNSVWFDYVNIDREYFYVKILKKKEKLNGKRKNKHKGNKN